MNRMRLTVVEEGVAEEEVAEEEETRGLIEAEDRDLAGEDEVCK
jgi:hypothetical protein